MGAMHSTEEVEDDWLPHNDEPPTICRDCDMVHSDTRSKPPFQWRCMKHPAPLYGGVVNPDYTPDPPYLKCERVNNGACPFWTPLRKPKEASND